MAKLYIVSSVVLLLVSVYGEPPAPPRDAAAPAPLPVGVDMPEPPAPPPIDVEEAEALEAKANTWLLNHPTGYVLRASRSEGKGFEAARSHNDDGVLTDKQMFLYNPDQQSYVNLGFKGDINKDMSAEDLQRLLSYIAVDRLPIQDFEHPSYWDIYPVTPMSSFSEGVTIDKFDGRQIRVNVKTKAFAVTGSRNDLQYAADSGQPAGTFFQVRQEFPMEVSLDVPIQLGEGLEE